MVSRRTDRMLHDMTHHTNLSVPYSDYISAVNYPIQNREKLGTNVILKYRNMYHHGYGFHHDGPETYEQDDGIRKGIFTIVRFDLTEPYRFIAVSLDGSVIIISKTDIYEEQITDYPIQLDEFIGLFVTEKYIQNPESEIKAVTLRVDNGEPCYTLLAELYSGNRVRFVLGDEVQSIVNEKYDPEGTSIYDGMDPTNYPLAYIDINGKSPLDEGSIISMDIDGKYPDPLEYLYRTDILTPDEVRELRIKIIKERIIYGSD